MSAFRCSNLHTAVLAMLAQSPGIVDRAQIEETARILRALNDAALFARYRDIPQPISRAELARAIPSAIEWLRTASNADISKVVDCFGYQCAEDIPLDYPGRQILGELQTRVFALPGAGGKSAVWEI